MKKILLASLAIVSFPVCSLAMVRVTLPNGETVQAYDTKDIENGVYCKINDASLLARNEADCTKAGGKVTHKHSDGAAKK